ncbi:MAG: AbrB/MazE/SpoVT family DNA-binding domain-containing protein [Tepidiformaceae bacterium]
MEIVTVSPKFQVVIPLAVRKAFGLQAGQKVMVRDRDGVIELVPLKPMNTYRGILRGRDVHFERDDDRV